MAKQINFIYVNVYRVIYYLLVAVCQVTPQISTLTEQIFIIPQTPGQGQAQLIWVPVVHSLSLSPH